jgi:hypothetical protein
MLYLSNALCHTNGTTPTPEPPEPDKLGARPTKANKPEKPPKLAKPVREILHHNGEFSAFVNGRWVHRLNELEYSLYFLLPTRSRRRIMRHLIKHQTPEAKARRLAALLSLNH